MSLGKTQRWLFGALGLCMAAAAPAAADVDRIEILERAPIANGKIFSKVGLYERIRGRLTFTIDPNAAENAGIVDLKLAPRGTDGKVTFAADFVLMKPVDPTRANGRLLYEVNNRGNIGVLGTFNDAGRGDGAGNGFLFDQGYTVLSTGWTWDTPPGGDRLRADLPGIVEGGRTVTGKITGEIAVTAPTDSATHVALGAIGYPPADPASSDAVLTVRDTASAARTVIPRNRWRFGRKVGDSVVYDPAWITLDGGFKPGALYQLTYVAREPRVVGLGLLAIRDAISFFRYARTDRIGGVNPLVEPAGELPTAVIAFGHSQSGRVMAAMMELGLTADGRNRAVIDGLYVSGAGGGKGSFNYRFAQAGRHFSPDIELDYPTDYFPFSTAPSLDPVTQVTASLFDRYTGGKPRPKVFFVNSAAEYWARSGSLIHTTADADSDLSPDTNARVYFIAGGQHIAARGGDRAEFSMCRNPLDYRPLQRGLLLRLDAWVTLNTEPPANAVPTLSEHQLPSVQQYAMAFPKIPAVRVPSRMLEPPRLDFGPRFAAEGIAEVPPKQGPVFAARVPAPDGDGNDVGGLRMPEVTVPLGTYTGWNLYNAATQAPDRIGRWDGSFIAFPRNENERIGTGDPRKSVAERYSSREAYREAFATATLALAEQELIVSDDVNPMIERAARFYDRVMARAMGDESCDYINDKR